MDIIFKAVKDRLPRFNDYLLKDFRKEQVNWSAEFISIIFMEAIKLFEGHLKYLGYRILDPEERLAYELKDNIGGSNVNIRTNELILVEYSFSFMGEIYTVKLFLPYLKDQFITINNTKYALQLTIAEKVFTKVNDGITAKVVRSPINFKRQRTYDIVSVSSGERLHESLITVRIHNKKKESGPNIIFPTVVHYLLCKYGFNGTLNIFNITPEDILVVENVNAHDIDLFEYYPCQKVNKSKSPLLLKVRKTILENIRQKRVVVSLLYLLNNYRKQTLENLYDSSNAFYKLTLGKLISGSTVPEAKAMNHVEKHMSSLSHYLDPITKKRLELMGIYANNIYDLLIYVFCNIDTMIAENSHSDLYDKRIDVLDNLLVSYIVAEIFKKFYNVDNKGNKLIPKTAKSLFKIQSRAINKIYRTPIVRMSPSQYNDNWLLSVGAKKTRQNSSINRNSSKGGSTSKTSTPEHRFHPSMAVVESIIAFSSSNPGISGTINPFLEIDSHGFIHKPDYAAEVDAILPYLPYK